MIEKISVGVDVVDINRFRKLNYKQNTSFFKRIFLKSEIQYCLKFKNSEEHFAGKFAVKEAVRKSIHRKVKFTDIITSHQRSKPKVEIKNKPQYIFQVSISHEKNIAVAVVLCEILIR
jgi:holo-[acyl-carrier protein] synthase